MGKELQQETVREREKENRTSEWVNGDVNSNELNSSIRTLGGRKKNSWKQWRNRNHKEQAHYSTCKLPFDPSCHMLKANVNQRASRRRRKKRLTIHSFNLIGLKKKNKTIARQLTHEKEKTTWIHQAKSHDRQGRSKWHKTWHIFIPRKHPRIHLPVTESTLTTHTSNWWRRNKKKETKRNKTKYGQSRLTI